MHGVTSLPPLKKKRAPAVTKVVIVGEAWGEEEERHQAPFVGASGRLLRGLLKSSGFRPEDYHLTNVFNLRPPQNNIEALCGPKPTGVSGWRALKAGKFVREEYAGELERLQDEIAYHNPNLIIALGNTALWALCKKVGIKKFRGAPTLTHATLKPGAAGIKIIPTWHPAAVLRQYPLRAVLFLDLQKCYGEAEFPEIRRRPREIWLEPTLSDIELFYNRYLINSPLISTDIETKGGTITEIGFAPDAERVLVIPFYQRSAADGNYWRTLEEELAAWEWVRRICAQNRLLGQNFLYDMMYLWRTVGIPCNGDNEDTMLLHHAQQPELEKGLGFLGSIYTTEPSWKFMRAEVETLKKED